MNPLFLGLTIFHVLIWQGFYSNFTVSSRSFLFQALHLNTEDINLVHGLFIPSKQEAGLTSIGEIGGIFSQINGIVKVENIKRI